MRATGPCWYAKWYRATKPVIRALGRAWVVVDHESEWKPRRGRPSDDALTESQAGQRMLEVIREHSEQQTRLERAVEARRRDGVTFRELAAEYLLWLEDVKDAKPSTLSGHRYLLAEPGAGHRRGNGRADGFIMAALGDQPASRISTRDIENVLRRVAAPRERRVVDEAGTRRTITTRVAPRTVNQHRQLMRAIFTYAIRPSTYGLPTNPAKFANRRREPEPARLPFTLRSRLRLSRGRWRTACIEMRARLRWARTSRPLADWTTAATPS